MMTDTIADMLTRIRNGLLMHQEQVTVPYSKLKAGIASLLHREGFIRGVQVVGEGLKKSLVLEMKYLPDGSAIITSLKRVSKISRRVYCSHEKLKPSRSGMGVLILTTSKGILSDREAKSQKIGGEVLLEVW